MSGNVADAGELDPGRAGASGRREHERRRAAREKRVRDRHPRLGGALLALGDAPRHERAWATGAAGEEALAKHLALHCPEIAVLHDRRLPRSRANVDHIAIAPSGVYVIDTKRYRGKVEVRRPLLGRPTLLVGGRDKTKLVDGLRHQVETVRMFVDELALDVPVHGCFCFVQPAHGESGVPLLRQLSIESFDIFYPRRLVKRLRSRGQLGDAAALELARQLAVRLPSA